MADKPDYKIVNEIYSSLNSIDKQLGKFCDLCNESAGKIKDYMKKLKSDAVNEALTEMSVDELSKAKQGIRISLLHENGIDNIAALRLKSLKELEAIKGIGPQSAKKLKAMVADIEDSVNKNVHIKINPENANRLMDGLVKELFCEKDARKISVEAKRLFDATHDRVRGLLNKAKPARNWFAWLLTPKKKKEEALQSIDELKELQRSSYVQAADDLFERRRKTLKAKHDEYWADFAKNAASYYAIMENIGSGKKKKEVNLLERPEEVAIKNGLSEELAVAIGDVEVDTTGLSCDLRSYQKYGVQYILNQGAVLLGDDMGLGKTVQAIASIVALKNTGGTHFMVVCPASVLVNWVREVEKFSDLVVRKIHGKDGIKEYVNWLNNGGVAITTFEMLAKLEIHEDARFSLLVVDEAHYVKNPNAARTVNLLKFRQHTDRALFMTGTPIENNVEEMCFLIDCLQPEIGKKIKGSTQLAKASEFRHKVSTVYFRRTKEDVLSELPEKIEKEEWCDLTKAEIDAYIAFVIEGSFSKMRQVSWLVENPLESSKAIRLKQLVEEYSQMGRKIIIFSFFLNTLSYVQKLFEENVYGPINGSISPQKRQEIIDNFSACEGSAVLLSQIQAGGTGLNIQAASVVIFCEPQLKPSIENQAVARAYRMGQINTVMVHRLLCDETVDEQIINLLKAKQNIFDNFADISESGLQSLSESEMAKSIVALEREKYAKDKQMEVKAKEIETQEEIGQEC